MSVAAHPRRTWGKSGHTSQRSVQQSIRAMNRLFRADSLERRVLLSGLAQQDEALLATIAELDAGSGALEVKWDQPPVGAQPQNLYSGWDVVSLHGSKQIAADDWRCSTADPVTDITWWGSLLGWQSPQLPDVMPQAFEFSIWTDVKAGVDQRYSHPGIVAWQSIEPADSIAFAGWELDPRTSTWEALFRFDCSLPESEWFYQGTSTDGIWWLSIAAIYPAGTVVQNPFGWATRARDPDSPAPDDAVVITNPTAPALNSMYLAGMELQSWDLAFELGATHGAPIKWEQPVNASLSGIEAHDSQDLQGVHTMTLADDWTCQGGAVTDLHWWGNYMLDIESGSEIRGSGIDHFHLSIHYSGGSLPGGEVRVWEVPFKAVAETYTGVTNVEGARVYSYEFLLPISFAQENGQNYWFDISAHSREPGSPAKWRWQESARSARPTLAPAAQRIDEGRWQSLTPPSPLMVYCDMAYAVTSGQEVHLVKWSQPPQVYLGTDLLGGWDEKSVYGSDQIVGDDWVCSMPGPLTRIDWWGSCLGWAGLDLPEVPYRPGSFQLGLWTDVPAEAASYSHPGRLFREWNVQDYNWEAVGWEQDPRDPLARPERVFHFWAELPTSEWFWQPEGENIHWLTVAATYPAFIAIPNPFGWLTRPHNPSAPDDAVRIFNPTAPGVGEPTATDTTLFPVPETEYVSANTLSFPETEVILQNMRMRPSAGAMMVPLPEGGGAQIDSFFDIWVEISVDGGGSWEEVTIRESPTRATIRSTTAAGGEELYATEIELKTPIAGPHGVMIRESPTRASGGGHVRTVVPGGTTIDSFFDIYIEVSTDGWNWEASDVPLHVETLPASTYFDGTPICSPDGTQSYDTAFRLMTQPVGAVTVIKDAHPDDPQDFKFYGDMDAFLLDDDSDPTLPNFMTFGSVPPGTYVLTEGWVLGWNLASIVIADPDGGSSVDLSARTVTIDVDAGENITVWFTNQVNTAPVAEAGGAVRRHRGRFPAPRRRRQRRPGCR